MTPNFRVFVAMVDVKYRTELYIAAKIGEESFRLNSNCILMLESLLGKCTYHK